MPEICSAITIPAACCEIIQRQIFPFAFSCSAFAYGQKVVKSLQVIAPVTPLICGIIFVKKHPRGRKSKLKKFIGDNPSCRLEAYIALCHRAPGVRG